MPEFTQYNPNPQNSSPQVPNEVLNAAKNGNFKDYASAAFSTTLPGAGLKIFGVDLFGNEKTKQNQNIADFNALKDNAVRFSTTEGISKELSFSLYVLNFMDYLRAIAKDTGFNPDSYKFTPIPSSAFKYLNSSGLKVAISKGLVPPATKEEQVGSFFTNGGTFPNPFTSNNSFTIIIVLGIIIVIFWKQIKKLFS